MRTIRTLGNFLLLAGALTTAACSSGGRTATACATDDQCGAAGRCVGGTCVADAPPVAALARPGGLTTFTLFTFDGSASADPDPQDAIRAHRWTFAAVDAPCAPPVVADTAPVANVRFACAGRYSVTLVVEDRMGLASAPVVAAFDVTDRTGAPMVMVGPDLALEHACAAARCAPSGEVALSATSTDGSAPAVGFRWTVTPPPDRPLDATRRVTFAPSANVANPTVVIETDDAAISGDWVFRVEARDAAGVLGTGETRVSITNRPPVVTATAPTSVPHAFDAATSRFTASGTITAVSVADPDGDPIPARLVGWVHANDGGNVFEGEDLGAEVTFRVAVQLTGPGDPAFLIGGAGLERAVRISATDVNGAETVESRPVVVENRPPVLVAAAPALSGMGHSYDAAQQRYRATRALGRWSDPDGDPLAPSGPTGDADCSALEVLADGTTIVLCSRAFTGVPDLQLFAGEHTVRESVRDPWAPSATISQEVVVIGDRAPVVTNTAGTESVSCISDIDNCCRLAANGVTCLIDGTATNPATFQLTPSVTDPDGDPVEVRFPIGVTPASVVCLGGTCPTVAASLKPTSYCGTTAPSTTISLVATDGPLSATGTHSETPVCR